MAGWNSTQDGSIPAALERQLFRAGAAHPFLREPIERMARIPDPALSRPATDGTAIFYSPSQEVPSEAVGHMLMHCLFRHLLPPEGAVRPLWDLACDVSAEFLCTEFFPSKDAQLTRLTLRDTLPEGVDPRIATAVYKSLSDLFEDELQPLAERCAVDDHRYWYAPPPRALFPSTCTAASDGRGIRPDAAFDPAGGRGYREWLQEALGVRWPSEDELPGGAATTGRYGLAPGSREEKMLLRQVGRYDFTRYLRRFSTTREELRLDLGGFDYIPYHYGLERYGNMPLIEPLEYTESHKVETLVIAVDTSGSCSRPVVERFFAEIERILMRHDSFFEKMNVHILQCDAMVQSHAAIHSRDAWKRYTKDIVVKGRGGTNFEPVFEWVERQQRAGGLRDLKGLLYFTDGDGAYPRRPTPYETAFVFTTRRALERRIPEWIVPLCLERPD